MNFSLITSCFFFFLLTCCSQHTKEDQMIAKKSQLRLELPRLVYHDSLELSKAIEQLDRKYNFEKLLGKSGMNVLFVRTEHDSVFFDFSTIDKEYLNLFTKKYTQVRTKGIIETKGRLLLVFDEVGLFENKNVSEIINFGYQESEYPIIDDTSLYRYYLKKKEGLIFIKETWLY